MSSRRFLLLAIIPLVCLAACKEPEPRILSIFPRIGAVGDILTIEGEHFGGEQRESYVTIGGISPTSPSYLEWRNESIILRIPEFNESGLVYVYVGRQKSNAALFTSHEAIPEPAAGEAAGVSPRISSVSPLAGSTGSLVTIQGSNFGSSRGESGVYFAWTARASASAPAEVSGPGRVEVSGADLGYEFWSDREIRVRVPDGAQSGTLEVETSRGKSSPQYFEVTGRPGTRTYRDKRSYSISYSVDIQVREASTASNTLYLWVPTPVISGSQRKRELLSRETGALVENYQGVSLYGLQGLGSGASQRISLAWLVDVYAVETAVVSSQIRSSAALSPLESAFTLATELIPSGDAAVKQQAAAIVGRETNKYLKAQRIYEWIRRETAVQTGPLEGGVLEALETKQADPYMAALLFCALARASGLAAQPVAGVLIDQYPGTRSHYWAEFWIEGFGWIPVDPALGAGAAPPSFNLREDHGAWYFGSLDNQRIAFSRGETLFSRMDPRGRITARSREYALQNLWEEAVGGLDSYSSLWSGIIINGVYAE